MGNIAIQLRKLIEDRKNGRHEIGNTSTQLRKTIRMKNNFLRIFLDPDSELLDILLSSQFVSWEDIKYIKDTFSSSSFARSEKLLNLILDKKLEKEFLEILIKANQTHLANFILANGEYQPRFGDDWPLTYREIAILDVNQRSLVDMLDTCDLLQRLYSEQVINLRQLNFIASKSTSSEKNEALLDILRRRSLSDYRKTIECLVESNQRHIAEVLDEGGVVVRLHSQLFGENVDEEEDKIANSFVSQLGNRSLVDSNRILELTQLKIIAARRVQSILLYVHYNTFEGLATLRMRLSSRELNIILRTLFNEILSRPKISNVITTVAEEEFQKGMEYFNVFHKYGRQTWKEELDFSFAGKTINDLPLELLDIILQKSYLHSTIRQHESHSGFISRLASVEFYWFQRITRRRFKHLVWRVLKGYYEHTSNKLLLYRSIRSYLEENLHIKELIRLLRSSDCLTDVQARIVSRQKPQRNTKYEIGSHRDNASHLLDILRTSEETQYSAFIRCLRQSKQNTIVKIMENGGVVAKAEIRILQVQNKESATRLFVKLLNDLHDKQRPRLYQFERMISRLEDFNIESLRSLYDRDAVVWIWCQSQVALDKLQEMNQSGTLVDVFDDLTAVASESGENLPEDTKTKSVNIDNGQLNRPLVTFSISISLTSRLEESEGGELMGVTKLGNRIYILLSRPNVSSPFGCVIVVFEDRSPFRLQRKIEIKEIEVPWDIVSIRKEKSLYVLDSTDHGKRCVWKIRESEEDLQKNEITRWLEFKEDYSSPQALSVNGDDQLLMVNRKKNDPCCSLNIYRGSDAGLYLSIRLPRDIEDTRHVAETSRGNFLIVHHCTRLKVDESGGAGAGRRQMLDWKFLVSEVSRDGKTVVRRFTPQNKEQNLNNPTNISMDSLGRVFLADNGNDRVILLDSNLQWMQILIPTKEEEQLGKDGKRSVTWAWRLYYDEESKQLIIVGGRYLKEGGAMGGANVYTLNRRAIRQHNN